MTPDWVQKFDRSQEHLKHAEQIAQWWLKTKPYTFQEQVREETGVREVSIVLKTPLPERLPVVLGDAIQNLRNSLDHIVVALATSNSGGYLMPKVEGDLAFPITTRRRYFRDARQRGRLGCVPPRAQAVIQSVQPYRRGKGEAFSEHLLWVLQELSNIDKHRRLPILACSLGSFATKADQEFTVDGIETLIGGTFKERAVILRWSPPDAEVPVDFEKIALEIAFGKGTPTPGMHVGPLVRQTSDLVQRLLAALSAYL